MKSIFKVVFIMVFFCFENIQAQGIITSSDSSVNAILASSTLIPKGDNSSGGTWSQTNAYWATPIIYRSRRFPEDGTGTFPFNNYGELMIQGTSHGSMYNRGISFLTWDGTNTSPEIRMRVSPEGNIGIGTKSPISKLDVNGTIHGREVKVDLNFPAPDYVFANDYNLRSLLEVEKYIKENSHLPEIPSAKELEQNGIHLAEMNMALLKKIEELTLYSIEQQKELSAVKAKLGKMEELLDKSLKNKN